MYDFYRQLNDFQDQVVRGRKTWYDDATFKNRIILEGPFEPNIINTHTITLTDDLFVRDDATVKDNLIIEGTLVALKEEIKTVSKTFQDQTIVDDVFIGGNLVVDGGLDVIENSNFWKELRVHNDATITGKLKVDGNFIGPIASHDHNYSDPVFDDATIKGVLRVENPLYSNIEFIIDEGAEIKGGNKGFLEIAFDCQVKEARLFCDHSGTMIIDIKKGTYSSFPSADSTLGWIDMRQAQKYEDTSLSNWPTTTINAGDVLRFDVREALNISKCTISFTVQVKQ